MYQRRSNLNKYFSIALCLLIAFPSFGSQTAPKTKRVRDRDACGIYLCEASYEGGKRKVDNTNGIKIAELDIESLKRALSGRKSIDGDLVISGLPIYGKQRKEFESKAKVTLSEWQQKTQADVSRMRMLSVARPGGPLWKRLLEEVRYFFPMKSDYQTPVKEEVIPGLGWVAFSDSSIVYYAFAEFSPSVAIPMVITVTAANGTLTAYMRALTNWMNRSEAPPGTDPKTIRGKITKARFVAERFAKQAIPSAFFVAAYYFIAKWPAYWDVLHNAGLMEASDRVIPELGEFIEKQGATILAQTGFFAATFTGVNLWDQQMGQTAAGNALARRVRPMLQGLIFWVTGPLLTMASTLKEFPYEVGPLAFNDGHKWLGVAGLFGLVLWRYPSLLNYVAPVIDKMIYTPLGWVKKRMKKPIDRVKAWANQLCGRDNKDACALEKDLEKIKDQHPGENLD